MPVSVIHPQATLAGVGVSVHLTAIQSLRVGVLFLIGLFFSRLGVGNFFVLFVFLEVRISFPGFRSLFAFPLVRVTSVFHGVRIFFFVFFIIGHLVIFRSHGAGTHSFVVLVFSLLALFLVVQMQEQEPITLPTRAGARQPGRRSGRAPMVVGVDAAGGPFPVLKRPMEVSNLFKLWAADYVRR